MASLRYGTLAPLVIVIAFKTLIDLGTRLSAISGVSPAPLLSAAGTTTGLALSGPRKALRDSCSMSNL